MRDIFRQVQPGGFVLNDAPEASRRLLSRGELPAEPRVSSLKKSTKGDDYYQPHPGIYVREGVPVPTGMIVIDTNMLAVMEYAPKAELLDEIFADNQGNGEEQLNRVQIFTTKSRCWVYQAESPRGYSKYWWPYDPRPAVAGKMIRAEIPRGTIVGVGIVGDNTRWYIPSTYGKGSNRRLPPTWRVEMAPDLSPAGPPEPVSA
ncbi:MAG: hypothetical protein JO055_06475 [Alphaproteobacteria bacterium]|nr:hypothetical protein [Alphaproteobacteria bacterium]